MSEGLAGQWAVITGAGSGIGRAVSLALAGQGANVQLVGRRAETVTETAALARAAGVEAQPHAADLGNDADLAQLCRTLGALSRVDMLIHSAGMFAMGRVESAPVAELDEQYRVNVRAPYVLTQALLPQLKASSGQVVFINSTAGLNARAQVGAYAASKHALRALADSLREEVNAEGVRVLSVYPGRTASPMQARVHSLEGRAYEPERLMQPEDVAVIIVSALVLPRTAEVTDLHLRPFRKT